MPAIRLPGRAALVVNRGPAPDRADLRELERCIVSRPRKRLDQEGSHLTGGGSNAGPVRHPTERSRPIHRLRPGVGQGARSHGRHAPFQGLGAPARAGRPRDWGHGARQRGPQDIRLVGPAWRPGCDDPGPDTHPQVQLALRRDHAARLAPAIALVLGPHRLEHLAYLVACHGLALVALA
jgi:hypothetical protein